jgi:hypothetical protein
MNTQGSRLMRNASRALSKWIRRLMMHPSGVGAELLRSYLKKQTERNFICVQNILIHHDHCCSDIC